jgi:hypothetical protein
LTVWFDVPPEVAAKRLAQARSPDRFEAEPLAFFQRVAHGYAQRCSAEPQRFARIDANAAREAVWLRRLLEELGVVQATPSVLYGDNQGAIALAKNPVAHARTKHIDVQHHFVRQQLVCGAVSLQYCPNAEMWADVLTKALPRDKHLACVQALGLHA